jgi:membrane protease YdiL (CAAX protease family)
VLTPFVRGVNIGLALLWRLWVTAPVPHPLQKLSETHPLPIDWALIVASAVLLAPFLEELLFRGVLQPWFSSRPYGGDIAVAGAILCSALAVSVPVAQVVEPMARQPLSPALARPLLIASAPLLFALVMVPVYLLLRRHYRSATVNGIFGAALLFGVVHSGVWPTPVALSLLGVGLGLLYYRTQSVVPSMVTHALFNGLSVMELVIQAQRAP